MQYYEKHIFVCENSREPGKRVSCGWSNSKKIREMLKLRVRELAPEKKIRVQMSGCLDRCELGPVQVSYPEGIWFSIRTPEEIELFVNNYILNNDIKSIQNLLIESK